MEAQALRTEPEPSRRLPSSAAPREAVAKPGRRLCETCVNSRGSLRTGIGPACPAPRQPDVQGEGTELLPRQVRLAAS